MDRLVLLEGLELGHLVLVVLLELFVMRRLVVRDTDVALQVRGGFLMGVLSSVRSTPSATLSQER